jgi:hypothetical protein
VDPGARLIFPVEDTQALALTASPTAGMPGPDVEAAVTVPLKVYSVFFFLQGPCELPPLTVTFPTVVVAPEFDQVRLPPEARLDAGPEAFLYPFPPDGEHFEMVTVVVMVPFSPVQVMPLETTAPALVVARTVPPSGTHSPAATAPVTMSRRIISSPSLSVCPPGNPPDGGTPAAWTSPRRR